MWLFPYLKNTRSTLRVDDRSLFETSFKLLIGILFTAKIISFLWIPDQNLHSLANITGCISFTLYFVYAPSPRCSDLCWAGHADPQVWRWACLPDGVPAPGLCLPLWLYKHCAAEARLLRYHLPHLLRVPARTCLQWWLRRTARSHQQAARCGSAVWV